MKSNLAAMPIALSYRLTDSPEHGCAAVWAIPATFRPFVPGPESWPERPECGTNGSDAGPAIGRARHYPGHTIAVALDPPVRPADDPLDRAGAS